MGFIKNNCITRRQEFCQALVTKHHIGKKKMVIHHHQVCPHCVLTRL